jgi:UDP-N-acetylglucosamine 2-epimerase (non-hydrolysing)
MRRRLVIVVGARPNFVKVAPVWHALGDMDGLDLTLLHTGQHYDAALSDRFLEHLDLPEPDVFLGVGSGTHAEQTAAVMVGVERHLTGQPADAILVAGDVNSTLGAALAASKLGVAVIHLEAGLRSGDWTMPEEINRILTDRLADVLLCPSEDVVGNLTAEGIDPERITVVGNTMIDSLFKLLPAALDGSPRAALGLERRGYVVVTLHRPALVDVPELLLPTIDALADIAGRMPVVLPLHPRTRRRLDEAGVSLPGGILALDPLGYLEFIALEAESRLVITDSGGVQEETSALGVPCLTFRQTTERPITTTLGTNRLVGLAPERLRMLAVAELERAMLAGEAPAIPLWDGRAGVRAGEHLTRVLADRAERAGEGALDQGERPG